MRSINSVLLLHTCIYIHLLTDSIINTINYYHGIKMKSMFIIPDTIKNVE